MHHLPALCTKISLCVLAGSLRKSATWNNIKCIIKYYFSKCILSASVYSYIYMIFIEMLHDIAWYLLYLVNPLQYSKINIEEEMNVEGEGI